MQRKEVQEFSRLLVGVIELVKLVKAQDSRVASGFIEGKKRSN